MEGLKIGMLDKLSSLTTSPGERNRIQHAKG